MATRPSTTRSSPPRPRRRSRTAAPVRSAVERAVDRVLTSDEAFALLIRRLEEAGWHVERMPSAAPAGSRSPEGRSSLTPPARAR